MQYYVTTRWVCLVRVKCMGCPWAWQAERSGHYYQHFLSPPLVFTLLQEGLVLGFWNLGRAPKSQKYEDSAYTKTVRTLPLPPLTALILDGQRGDFQKLGALLICLQLSLDGPQFLFSQFHTVAFWPLESKLPDTIRLDMAPLGLSKSESDLR